MFKSPLDSHYSQTHAAISSTHASLRALWILTTLKPLEVDMNDAIGLRALWILTTLKHMTSWRRMKTGLRALWILTTLKRNIHIAVS